MTWDMNAGKSWSSARRKIEAAADRGDWQEVGRRAFGAQGSVDDDELAETVVPLVEPGVATGNPTAMTIAGWFLRKTDPERAVSLTRAAADRGYSGAMNNLYVLLKDDAPVEALEWESKAADLGSRVSLYRRGARRLPDDRIAGISDLTKAAELGHVGAMERIAVHYLELDSYYARAWYEKAARKGSSGGQYMLGAFLLRPWERVEKVRLLRQAAEMGHGRSMTTLARLTRFVDPEESWAWAQRAAETGNEQALKIVAAGPPKLPWLRPVTAALQTIVESAYWVHDFVTVHPGRLAANRARLGVAYLQMQTPAGVDSSLALLRNILYPQERVRALSSAREIGTKKPLGVFGVTDQRLLWARGAYKEHAEAIRSFGFDEIEELTWRAGWIWGRLEFGYQGERGAYNRLPKLDGSKVESALRRQLASS